MSGTPALQTVLKTVQVLEALAQDDSDSVSLSRVSTLLGWSRTATHQYLSSLVRAGWLQQDGDRQYQVTSRAALFGRFAIEHAGIPASIPRVMQELVEELNEAVSFAVLQGNEAVFVERFEPLRPFAIHRDAERHMPLGASASGEILLAFDPIARDRLGSDDESRWAEVRGQGFAQAHAEWMGDMIEAAAVPVLREGQCLGALSVIAPEGRMDIDKATDALVAARAKIESELSGADGLEEDTVRDRRPPAKLARPADEGVEATGPKARTR
jgi:DNA-binding IclR family transcriptional regulator